MSMVKTRTREIMGPYPGSFAVLARPPNSCDLEALFRAQNEAEIEKQAIEARSKVQRAEDLRSEWEQNSNKKVFAKTVMRKVEEMKRSEMVGLEGRRERLRTQLSAEEDAFLAELDAQKETTIERQAKMRARAKDLREVREEERKSAVTARYEQQFRENCDEVRQDLKMRNLQAVVADRVVQMADKQRVRANDKQVERMWAAQWENDRVAKMQREEKEERDKAYKNRERLSILSQQKNAAEAQRQEEKRLKREEGQIMKEQEAMRELEALQEKYATIRKAERYREDLRRCRRLGLQKEYQRQQEELALDLEMLERLDREIKDDLAKEMNSKKRMHDELESYMSYLSREKTAKAAEEQEIHRLADIEVEKAWEKREAQWAKEREARGRLLNEVIQSWHDQINAHLSANLAAQQKIAEERRQFAITVEENKQEEAERAAELAQKTKFHAHDLRGQINYNNKLASEKKYEEARMHEDGLGEENEYQRKVQYILDNPDLKRVHPLRLKTHV